MNNPILVVQHPHPEKLQLNFDHAQDIAIAIQTLKNYKYQLVLFPVELISNNLFKETLIKFAQQNKATLFIVVAPANFDYKAILELNKNIAIYKTVYSYSDSKTEEFIYSALEQIHQGQQKLVLTKLMLEQNKQLQLIKKELEERVEKRQKFLIDSRSKLYQTNNRLETLRKAMLGIQQSASIGDIEIQLNQILSESIQLAWTRIFFKTQDDLFLKQISTQMNFHFLQIPLFQNHDEIGSVFFLKTADSPFTKNEKNLLNKITESISLALDRLHKLNLTLDLKQQWGVTFDSISDPLSLIDSEFNIVQSNREFEQQSQLSTSDTIGQKCYKALFQRETPCEGCQLGKSFQIESQNQKQQIYAVHSQPLKLNTQNESLFVNLYHNITEQTKLERQIVERSKLAELGTIASSIAHELNNPLGGVLSFIQIIKMDLDKNDPIYCDIDEMEKGAQRCKEIIQNLLGFARNYKSPDQT